MTCTSELRLVPASGLCAHRQDEGRWLSTTDHSCFELAGLERWAGRWIRFRLRLELEDGGVAWPQLQYDHGGGFSKLHPVQLPPCSPGAPEIDFMIVVPATARAVRLAPVSRKVGFVLAGTRATPLTKYMAAVRMLAAVAKADGLAAAAGHIPLELLSLVRRLERYPLTERYREICLRRSTSYAEWIDAFEPAAASYEELSLSRTTLPRSPKISVLMQTCNTTETLLRQAIDSVRAQIYPDWQLCIADDASTAPHVGTILHEYERADSRIRVVFRQSGERIAAAANPPLSVATGDFIAVLDDCDTLHPLALHFVAEAIARQPDAGLVYTDEDKIDSQGRRFDPYFKCDFNYELLLAQNMVGRVSSYRRNLVEEAAGFGNGAEGLPDYELAFRAVERLTPSQIVHVPRVLYHRRNAIKNEATSPGAANAAGAVVHAHLRRRGVPASVSPAPGCPGMNRVRYGLPAILPGVSIIIPTRDRHELLSACLTSIAEKTTYANREVVIVDNGSRQRATAELLQRHASDRVRVIRDESPFNFSALNNRAVAQSGGEYVCLLNNDIEIITPDWIEELLSFASQPGVGAVGARLWYPDGRLQHGGVILGLISAAGHIHRFLPRHHPGYFGRALVHQSLSALTAACLMVRKSVYTEVGGLDTNFAVAFNDIDFCLRLRGAGYRNVWTPYAEMIHRESASRGRDATPAQLERAAVEIELMERRWGDQLLHDPAYSPNLTVEREDCSMAWPPRI